MRGGFSGCRRGAKVRAVLILALFAPPLHAAEPHISLVEHRTKETDGVVVFERRYAEGALIPGKSVSSQRRKWGLIVAMVTAFCIGGCTTTRSLERIRASTIADGVDIGDTIKVITVQSRIHELEVTALGADALYGTSAAGQRYAIPYSAIESIRIEEVSFWKTTGAAILGVAAVAVVLYQQALRGL